MDPQRTKGPRALSIQVFQRAGNLIDGRPQPLDQATAGVGQRYAARCAMQ
jgi:hypothetical protein